MGKYLIAVAILLVTSCAGAERGCSSCAANRFGADWIIVQVDLHGLPYRCWTLEGVSVANEPQSDGIYWRSPDGHLVHISNLYNRVQVVGDGWEEAANELGMTMAHCEALQEVEHDDRYVDPRP